MAIWYFFLLENLLSLVFQGALIGCSALPNRRHWLLSLRASAMLYLAGMGIIVSALGLLSPWLIIYFFSVQGLHLLLLLRTCKIRQEPRVAGGYASVLTRPPVQARGNNAQAD